MSPPNFGLINDKIYKKASALEKVNNNINAVVASPLKSPAEKINIPRKDQAADNRGWADVVDAIYGEAKNKGIFSDAINDIVGLTKSGQAVKSSESDVNYKVPEISIDKEISDESGWSDLIDKIIKDPSTPDITAESLIKIEEIEDSNTSVEDNDKNLQISDETMNGESDVSNKIPEISIDKEIRDDSGWSNLVDKIIKDPSIPDITEKTLIKIEEIVDPSTNVENTLQISDDTDNRDLNVNNEVPEISIGKEISDESGWSDLIDKIIKDPSTPDITEESLIKIEEIKVSNTSVDDNAEKVQISDDSTNEESDVTNAIPDISIDKEISDESSWSDLVDKIIKDPSTPDITEKSLIKIEETDDPNTHVENTLQVSDDTDNRYLNVNKEIPEISIDKEINDESGWSDLIDKIIKDPSTPDITEESLIKIEEIKDTHTSIDENGENIQSSDDSTNGESDFNNEIPEISIEKGPIDESGWSDLADKIIKDPSTPDITAETLIRIEEIENPQTSVDDNGENFQISDDTTNGESSLNNEIPEISVDKEPIDESDWSDLIDKIIKDPSTPKITAESLIKIEDIEDPQTSFDDKGGNLQLSDDTINRESDVSNKIPEISIDKEISDESGWSDLIDEIIKDPSTPDITEKSLIKIEEVFDSSTNVGNNDETLQVSDDTDNRDSNVNNHVHEISIDHDLNDESSWLDLVDKIIKDPSTPDITEESFINIEEVGDPSTNVNTDETSQVSDDTENKESDVNNEIPEISIDKEISDESSWSDLVDKIIKDPSTPDITEESLIKIKELSDRSETIENTDSDLSELQSDLASAERAGQSKIIDYIQSAQGESDFSSDKYDTDAESSDFIDEVIKEAETESINPDSITNILDASDNSSNNYDSGRIHEPDEGSDVYEKNSGWSDFLDSVYRQAADSINNLVDLSDASSMENDMSNETQTLHTNDVLSGVLDTPESQSEVNNNTEIADNTDTPNILEEVIKEAEKVNIAPDSIIDIIDMSENGNTVSDITNNPEGNVL